jgi:hypothetical protein
MDSFWTAKAEETGLIVRLFCVDTKCFLRVNKNGRLFADIPQEDISRIDDSAEFQLYRVRHPFTRLPLLFPNCRSGA